jgi:Lamin Tail Domain
MKKIFTLLLISLSFASFAQIRISSVYPGGGNTGATYNRDYVELFNAGNTTVSIDGWSIQYVSAAGTGVWASYVFPVGTSIAPGKYFLFASTTPGTNGVALPTPDFTGGIAMGASAGKVALVINATALSGGTACSSGTVVDVLGYGSTASCFEGTVFATAPTTAQCIKRTNECIDNNVNSTDFAIATFSGSVVPRNSATAPNICINPTISANPDTINLSTTVGVPSASMVVTLSASNLIPTAGNLTIDLYPTLEISFDNTTFSPASSQLLPYTSGNITSTQIFVRTRSTTPQGASSPLLIFRGGGAYTDTVFIKSAVSQNFYSQPTGNLSVLSTWGIVNDGTGSTPTNFTSPYQIFNVVNRTNAMPGDHWEVSGTASKIIIGDGTNPTTVTTSVTDTILGTTIVDIKNLGTLEIGSRVAPTFGSLSTGSTVNYNFNGTATTDTVKINAAIYYHLTLKDGLKYLRSGITTVNGNLMYDGTIKSNGAASPFSTISLKGNLMMANAAVTEDSTTGSANRFTLSMAGIGTQLISTQGSELNLFRIIRDTTVLSNVDITLAANSKITLGNNTSGGLSLLQKVSGTPTITRMVLNNNAQLAIVKNGIVFTDATKAGKINSTNGKIIMNKSITSTANPGTLVFETGSTLTDLTVNITTPARDSVIINGTVEIAGNVNLTKGVVVLTPASTMIINAAATITGGSTSSYIDGKIRTINPSTSTFLFPTGQAKQYAPVEMSGLTSLSDFTVQYFKQAYSNLLINPSTSAATPGYKVSAKEYWNIDRVGTINPNIKFYYNPTSLVDGSQAKIAHFNGVDWDDIGRDSYGADVNGNFIAQNTISTFSPFTFGGTAAVLPIILQSFNGSLQNNNSTLQWKTSCEGIGDAFELQYSTNGINFATIYYTNAVGDCNGVVYNYVHKNAVASVNYYRLILKSVDGLTKNSNILTLKNSKLDFETTLQSTVVKDQLVLSITSPTNGLASVIISNLLGQQLYHKNIAHVQGTQLNYIPVEKLNSGMYLLTIKNSEGEVNTMRFIKN